MEIGGRRREAGSGIRRFHCASVFSILAFVLLLFVLGCASRSHVSAPRVESVDEKKLNDILRKNHGRVVLLNFWATWCVPCVEEFPDLVRLAQEERDRLAFIAVSIDEEEDLASKVVPFLEKHGMVFDSYIKKTRDDEAFINNVDAKWSGAIPATFIYRPDGTLAQRLVGQQTYEKFLQAVQLATAPREDGTGK